MKGIIGSSSIYHTRVPYQWRLERTVKELSKEAVLRLRWIDHYLAHNNARATCRYFHISPAAFYKWKKRFERRGLIGLESLSRAPKRRRVSKVPWQAVDLIVKIRKQYPAWSKHKIAVLLCRDHGITLSASTVGRIMKRKGLYEKRKGRAGKRAARRRAKREMAAKWMESAFPGSLVQVDTKYLYFGKRKYYQFTAVDSFTRLGFIWVSSSSTSASSARFLERLTEFFPFPIMGVQTDNGSEYLKDFDKATEECSIDHYFTYPRCPQQNAHVERNIQTSELEF